MAGTLLISSIQLDSDNNFSIISNTGTTLLSANGTGLITGVANNSLANKTITNPTITTPTISSPTITGNTTIDSGTLFVDATNDKVGIGTINPVAKFDSRIGLAKDSDTATVLAQFATNDTTDPLAFKLTARTGQGSGNYVALDVAEGTSNRHFIIGYNGTERFRIDSSGRVTMPLQPAFDAYLGSDTAISTGNVIPFNGTNVNIGSCFNTSTYRFTAPIAGTYLISVTTQISSGAQQYYTGMRIMKNGSEYYASYVSQYTTDAHAVNSRTFVVTLAANDYLSVNAGSNSSTTVTFQGTRTSFSGFLIG